ncbi:hypothetical protein BD324DRAFT_623520 [Kockovaella imperatae]|uniref:Inactive metallocarboxypeptidase ECM14 n=1 Tax=Kockovaella imperatae TaxID=4999 RepID=A0A1Y1UK57_9TREE|nr:hypothetical protein BD324DRAFT_623520 [Kockovaella imperatae]ORX37846.1 hypothetical protein BD324DRAFT_623520 [Kockovaella imperatae]
MIAKIIALPTIASLLTSFLAHALPASNPQSPFLASSSRVGPQRFDNEQVWRLNLTALDSADKDNLMNIVKIMDLDVWHASPSQLDVRLDASQTAHLRQVIPSSMPFEPMIPDLQSAIERSSVIHTSLSQETWDVSTIDTPFHDSYHTLDDLYSFGDQLQRYFNGYKGVKIESFVVGTTFQDRQIRGWKASIDTDGGTGNQTFGKKKQELEFVLQSGQHAREWIGPSTALYYLHWLLLAATSGHSPEALLALRTFTFTVVPTINPDGYVYSQEHSRMWRKNRQYLGVDNCVGIDLNANWGYKWRKPQHNNPCAETYAGKAAFEAFETRAMADYLLSANGPAPLYEREGDDEQFNLLKPKSKRIRAFVDLHSYGQLFMYPFAHSCEDFPFDAENLMEASLGVAKAMRQRDGEAYMTGQACDLTYRAPGDSIDFAYGTTDVRWSFSTELRDTGVYGFLLPASYIRPTGEEISAGLTFLAKFIYTTEIAG